ncbi:MAG: hypothetical protein H6814_11580 [Phycisphaeraceae bacterium]|nr:hypothetical protein [Phycisphaeraceae bacterium]
MSGDCTGICTNDLCIHDNEVYGYRCEIKEGILVLHTEFIHPAKDAEFTDVVFSGVEVHRLWDVIRPQNMLDEIEVGEVNDIRDQVTDAKSLISQGAYLDLADHARCKLFHIRSSNGMKGWVAAQSAMLVKRSHRAADICMC